ncbi:isochorismate synthase MenF [Paramixta manurensis]|uniref:Isochorismate synthase MenF n=1 Tax=Paramixta manurensis TaxID=2740817 RepID=A0A6M8UAT2_9GAMM|nr:isochorismate synthase MenF [Erwiniaceae bacterium PD-1]
MLILSAALQQLRAQLTRVNTSASGHHRLQVKFSSTEDTLTWLASQPCWPQLWWQHRHGTEQVAACGAVAHFAQFSLAQQFSRRLPPDWRIWGCNNFSAEESYLFLPRLIWRRCADAQWLIVNLYSENALYEDAQQALAFLDTLTSAALPATLPTRLQHKQHAPDKAAWCQMVTQAIEGIQAGAMEKVVLARATDLHFEQKVSAAALLAQSRHVNLHCYHFMLAFDADTAFLGSSPERLYLRQHTELLTEALAGTVARDSDERTAVRQAEWLCNDDKNQRENWLVVDDICQRLHGMVSGLDVMPPEVVRLRKVQHLRRRIHAALRSHSDELCLTRLQPTAAVAGLPRQAARNFILRHEPFEREWYAGSMGYLSARQSEFCVSLRSARVDGARVRLYAGAGIVAGSDPELEWQEIDNKAAALASLLTPEAL